MNARLLVLVSALVAWCGAWIGGCSEAGNPPGAGSELDRIQLTRRWRATNDAFVLSLARSGEATSWGGAPTWPVRGDQVGRVEQSDFELLARLVAELDVEGLLAEHPEVEVEDRVTLALGRGDDEVELRWTHGQGPAGADALALAVEAVGRRILWRPADEQDLRGRYPEGVPERYAFLQHPLLFDGPSDEELAAEFPYSRVELDRSACFGSCPSFLFTLEASRATWDGREYVDQRGYREAETSAYALGRICWYVESTDLERFRGKYQAGWTDDQTTIVRLTRPDGEVVEFHDYGRRSPIEVQALWLLLEDTASWIDW